MGPEVSTRYTANGKCIRTGQSLTAPDTRREPPTDPLELIFVKPADVDGDLDA
ncbi:hypothetical protein [Streptomyces caelestis]|uniref:hypothetical protein n=1 Tax=Streptomyces caelestis TaxID=36816 RepID=UPI001610328A|nr:hypothetical protein [Streptomyces caelestis]